MSIKPIMFEPYGPFSLAREAGAITPATLQRLWEDAHEVALGIGVYIIAARSKNEWIPWYVGKTDKGFQKRFRQHSRSEKHVFAKLKSICPHDELFVIFLARQTPGGKLKKARRSNSLTKTKAVASILRLEYDVLRKAHDKNSSSLINKSNRMYLGKLSVPGFTGAADTDKTPSAKTLRNLLGS